MANLSAIRGVRTGYKVTWVANLTGSGNRALAPPGKKFSRISAWFCRPRRLFWW